MFKKLVCALFLMFISVLFSQEPIHYFLGKDIFNGTQLYSIIQGADNSMWISSNKGVFHYDGVNFTSVSIESSKRDAFLGLTIDNNNNVFCYNFSGQIFKIVNKKLELFYTLPPNKIGNNLHISFDNLNNLIIGSGSNLIKVSYNTKESSLHLVRGWSTQKRRDTLYYGKGFRSNKAAIVSRFNNKETIFKKLPMALAMYTKIYFHRNKLYTFCPKKNEFYLIEHDSVKTLPLSLPKGLYYDYYHSSNSFWFKDNTGGVYKVEPENLYAGKKIKKWFNNYKISGVYTDFENNTWLLTFDDGIIIIPNLNVSNFKIDDEKLTEIRKINSQIYVSTNKNKIYTFKNGVFSPFFAVKNDRFESFSVFKKENIITSSTSIYKGNKCFKDIISFNRGTILVNDSIFIALHSGLYKFNIKTNKLEQINLHRTYDILLSKKRDKIYFSSMLGGLVYDFNKVSALKYDNKDILPRKLTLVNDEVWVSSKNGIYVIKEKKIIKNLTVKDGLLSNNVERIKYEHPYVYITNDKGFQQYNIQTKTFNNLIEGYGLIRSIKNFEVLNDTIYAVTTNGLSVFSFNDSKSKAAKYKTRIIKAIANGNKEFKNNSLLKSNENNVAFSFLTTSYRYQKKIDYSYQLMGYDKQPVKASKGQYIVNYSNLPAGNYTFKVFSTIYEQQNYPATIKFSIQQHWYKTSWFKIAVISLIILMLYSIYVNRMKALNRKRKQEQFEKAMVESSLTSLKAQMNPHFLFNVMNSVQSLILREKKDDAYSYLTKLSRLIRETLNMSEKTWVYLDEEIEQITNYLELEKLRFGSVFSYTINVNDNVLNTIMIPSMIVQPFIENSVKHGLLHRNGDKYIVITFKKEHELMVCVIEDNGIGRKASSKINSSEVRHKSFSTNAIQKRFKLYKQYLNKNVGFEYEDLYNKQGQATGTRVTVKTPYKTDEE